MNTAVISKGCIAVSSVHIQSKNMPFLKINFNMKNVKKAKSADFKIYF
jgi:hypothetical protein